MKALRTTRAGHPAEDDRLAVSIQEAARLLGVSRSFAYELCSRRELPTVRLGRRLVVPRRVLVGLIENAEADWHRTGGRQPA